MPAPNTKPGAVYFRYSTSALAAGDVAAATAERLAERAHPDVDVARVDAEMLADAAAVQAQHADRVGLVDLQERLVPLLDFDELRQVGMSPSMLYTPSMAISTRR